jgi:uncharacterized protein YbbK (DUF523 family)
MKAISSCLKGIKCRYNGTAAANLEGEYLLVCPELFAKMPVPRAPMEIVGKITTNTYDDLIEKKIKIVDQQGNDYSQILIEGANKALEFVQTHDIKEVILKDKSPTCGSSYIYDGTFENNLINGAGIFASLLRLHNIDVISYDKEKESLL